MSCAELLFVSDYFRSGVRVRGFILTTLLYSYGFQTEVYKFYAITNVGKFAYLSSVFCVAQTVRCVQAGTSSNITSNNTGKLILNKLSYHMRQ